jgi:hypothetical protein
MRPAADKRDSVYFAGRSYPACRGSNTPTVAPWMQVPFAFYPQSYDYAVYGGIYRDDTATCG